MNPGLLVSNPLYLPIDHGLKLHMKYVVLSTFNKYYCEKVPLEFSNSYMLKAYMSTLYHTSYSSLVLNAPAGPEKSLSVLVLSAFKKCKN